MSTILNTETISFEIANTVEKIHKSLKKTNKNQKLVKKLQDLLLIVSPEFIKSNLQEYFSK